LQQELRVLEMLTVFYAAVGNAPETDTGLALMAKLLSARAEPQAINAALERCLVECRYPIRIPDILQRIPGTEAADVDGEKRRAWEAVERFVSKYVGNDVQGNYGPEFGWYGPQRNSRDEIVKPATYPQLCDRILDTVRRTGGWKVYARMTEEDFPFVQKRFFEEYEAWIEVERLGTRLLETPRGKELVAAKTMEPERPRVPAPVARPIWSPEKRRIMRAIANTGKPRRV
jgi:hypothetical protein